MQNEKLKDKPHRSEFAAEFLNQLFFTDPLGIVESRDFFKKAYLELSSYDEFNQPKFRAEFLEHINYLNDLSRILEKFSKKQIDKSLDFAQGLLINSKKHGNE